VDRLDRDGSEGGGMSGAWMRALPNCSHMRFSPDCSHEAMLATRSLFKATHHWMRRGDPTKAERAARDLAHVVNGLTARGLLHVAEGHS
jgi:hypothetical protein